MIPFANSERQHMIAKSMPNRLLEWTYASWPRYAAWILLAPRGQLASAPQLER